MGHLNCLNGIEYWVHVYMTHSGFCVILGKIGMSVCNVWEEFVGGVLIMLGLSGIFVVFLPNNVHILWQLVAKQE